MEQVGAQEQGLHNEEYEEPYGELRCAAKVRRRASHNVEEDETVGR